MSVWGEYHSRRNGFGKERSCKSVVWTCSAKMPPSRDMPRLFLGEIIFVSYGPLSIILLPQAFQASKKVLIDADMTSEVPKDGHKAKESLHLGIDFRLISDCLICIY